MNWQALRIGPQQIDVAKALSAPVSARYKAELVDEIVALCLAALVYWAFAWNEEWQEEIAFAFFLGFWLLQDGLLRGRSLGMRVMGMAVVHRQTGKPCGLGQALLRNLSLALLGPLDLVWGLASPHRRLGDRLAKTLVVCLPSKQH